MILSSRPEYVGTYESVGDAPADSYPFVQFLNVATIAFDILRSISFVMTMSFPLYEVGLHNVSTC